MPLYEHVFLARQDVTAQHVEDMTTQYKGVIESNGGTIAKTEYWGVKTLNFRIKKNRKAHFAYIGIDGPPAAITEMERQMRINEDVLRFMTIRIEAFDEGPTIMMQKRDREERREERRGERRRDRGGEGDDLALDPIAPDEVTP